jgi:hypothetical protein
MNRDWFFQARATLEPVAQHAGPRFRRRDRLGVKRGTDHNHSALAVGAFLQLSGTQSAHKLHTSVLQGLGHTAATGFGIEPTCGPLAGILG